MNFFGRKFFPWVIGILTGGIAFSLVMVFCSAMGMLDKLEGHEGSIALVVVSFILAIGIGFLVGFLVKKFYDEVGVLLLGGATGYFLGTLIYNLVF